MRSLGLLTGIFAIASAGYAVTPKDVPGWVQEVSSRPVPAYSGKVPAVVLLSEQHVVLDSAGLVTTTTREAIKILNRQGQKSAAAEEVYFKGGRSVKNLRAWLIAPNGFVKTYGKSSIAELGEFSNMELYNDIRMRRIVADNPETGAVFAYESEVEEHALFAQDEYFFQTNLPAIQSRYVLTLPAGWTATAVTFNHAAVQPMIDGSTYTWELKDLPFREQEEHGPTVSDLAARLAVDFRSPPSSGQSAAGVSFRNWTEISAWHTALAAGQDAVTPEIEQKVRELTANALSEYAKIQAIAQFVQKIKYVAIEMDTLHGGGYKPHAADVTFHNRYGDCKDKANLMRAMLKAAGIPSYLVAIWSGDRTFVREEWPSPRQFNHMILAIRLSEGSPLPSAVAGFPLGRLLLFDPTSETTPIGDLPPYEQSSFALLCAGNQGALFKMPQTTPDANVVDVKIDAKLSALGELTASLASTRTGHPAGTQRFERLFNTPEEFQNRFARQLSENAKAASISHFDVQDSFAENTLRLKLDFTSRAYGQVMQDRLLIFGPGVLAPPGPHLPDDPDRTEPILLNAAVYRKHVRIRLPDGFVLDDTPQNVKSDSVWGHFSLTFQQESHQLMMEEELTTEAVTLPADQYQKAKRFFDLFDGADQQRALLLRTGP